VLHFASELRPRRTVGDPVDDRGQRDPGKLVALTDRRLNATPNELYDALHGPIIIIASCGWFTN
jgi:hypothetical protein